MSEQVTAQLHKRLRWGWPLSNPTPGARALTNSPSTAPTLTIPSSTTDTSLFLQQAQKNQRSQNSTCAGSQSGEQTKTSSECRQTFPPRISGKIQELRQDRSCISAQSSSEHCSELSSHISTDLSHNSLGMHFSKPQTSEHMYPLR